MRDVENEMKVVRIPVKTPTLWPNTETNCYLIGNEKESILVDAGYDQPETKTILENALKEHQFATPHSIILTHGHHDHAQGVKQLSHWSPTVYCHEKELDVIKVLISPVENIKLVKDNEKIDILNSTITILHTPGHSSGHISLYLPELKILLSGDNVVSEGTTWIGPPDGDMKDYFNSLERLKTFEVKKIGPGHGDWVTEPYEKLEFLYKRRLKRENQILEFFSDYKTLTVEKATELIYKDKIHPSVIGVAQRTVEAHLLKLVNEGKVTQLEENLFTFSS